MCIPAHNPILLLHIIFLKNT